MNKKIKRTFLIVLDSVGAGALSDADSFGDVGAFTLHSLHKSGKLCIENLRKLGIGNIKGLEFLSPAECPIGAFAKCAEQSMGKDTTIGHWEICGHISSAPLPTFPNGFPAKLTAALEARSGRKVICNKPYSGTDVICDFGEEHKRDGSLILYTSADSVCQIAAHTDVVSLDELYSICQYARDFLTGELAVGRVIARPFAGEPGSFYRLPDRRDFSLVPPQNLLPDAFCSAELDSISVGKIYDIFAGRGFTRSYPTHSNAEGMATLSMLQNTEFCGLCFANLVDFDMVYGHRRDVLGYATALNEFDKFIGEFISNMRDDDLLIITADHGCDPAFTKSTDHTREYTPLLIYSADIVAENFGIRSTFADIAATIAELFALDFTCSGTPILLNFKK